MTLRIERIPGKRRTRIRLSGAFRSEHFDQVKAEIERGGPQVALDLEEVDLVDVEGVRFLNACEAEGIQSAELLALHQGLDAPGTRSAKSIRARLEDEDGKHVNRHFGFGHQVAGLPRQKRRAQMAWPTYAAESAKGRD